MGRVIRPGDPEGSPLMAFIDGRRGPAQRMPMNAPPLKPEQIDVIRRWIAEGAKEDADNAPKLVIHREVEIKSGSQIQIEGQAPNGCFVTVEASDTNGKQRWIAESPKPPFTWKIVGEQDWPPRITIAMTVRYCTANQSQVAIRVNPR